MYEKIIYFDFCCGYGSKCSSGTVLHCIIQHTGRV